MIPDFPQYIWIRLTELEKKLLHPDVAKSLSCWLSQFSFSKLRQPIGQRLSNVRTQHNKQKFQFGQSYSYIMRKVWYHQIWIQTTLVSSFSSYNLHSIPDKVSMLIGLVEFRFITFSKKLHMQCFIFYYPGWSF